MFTLISHNNSQIPNPYIWLRTDHSASLILVNNTTCSRWNDWRDGSSSGLTGSALQSPFYTASGYIGKPALRFVSSPVPISSADYLQSEVNSKIHDFFSGSYGYTFAGAFYINNFSSSATLSAPFSTAADTTNNSGWRITNAGVLTHRVAVTGSSGTLTSNTNNVLTEQESTASTLIIAVGVFSGSVALRTPNTTGSGFRNTACSIYKNKSFTVGALDNSRNSGLHAFTSVFSTNVTATYPCGPIRFGIQRLATSNFNQFDGEWFEFMAWPRPLSEPEMNAVRYYLERWK